MTLRKKAMSARGRVGFLLWFVLPVACCPQHAAMLEKRSPVMQIKFARSGGFAGAATNIEGTVASCHRAPNRSAMSINMT